MKLNADVDEVVLTAAGYAELQRELERLQTVRLPEATGRLRQALEFAGDRGEDLEYRDATREREELEERIARLEARLATARVLEPSVAGPSARAALGLRVELQDLDTGQQSSFQLVGSAEANPGEGRLSIESPVGRALIGHAGGEVVEAATPHGTRHLRIVGVGAENSERRWVSARAPSRRPASRPEGIQSLSPCAAAPSGRKERAFPSPRCLLASVGAGRLVLAEHGALEVEAPPSDPMKASAQSDWLARWTKAQPARLSSVLKRLCAEGDEAATVKGRGSRCGLTRVGEAAGARCADTCAMAAPVCRCASCGGELPLQIGRTYCASCAASITPAERTRRWRVAKRAERQEYRLFRRDEPLPVWVYRAWLNQLAALARDSREAAAARTRPAPEPGEKSASAAGLRQRSRRQ